MNTKDVNEEKTVNLTREMKIYLLASMQKGYIEVEEMRKVVGFTRPEIILQVIESGIPLARNEDEIYESSV